MNQLSKENSNLVRLINRLENNPTLQIKKLRVCTDNQSHSVDLDEKAHKELNHHCYWELKGLETTIRHARSILDTISPNPSTLKTVKEIQDPLELRNKLERIRDRIDLALKTCAAPTITTTLNASSQQPSTLICEIKRPELPSMPKRTTQSIDEKQALEEEKNEKDVKKENKKHTEECNLTEKKSTNIFSSPADISSPQPTSHMTTNQEELTEELSQMASQLKKNVHHFNKLLIDDQAILLANQTKLELNSDAMNQQGDRLNQVSLKSRSMTWFTILAISVVAISWILMFIIIRLT
ncbi:hypothetical protein PSTT_10837 [Puccinia striiformis]|uniref:Uncharacterized protein n=1 Tax=Puccinia striiformis TaxID=27350 RepID=A0A2S4V2N3_9BASI|nr:hypothetical protein PSTT_10837 [Puccinia striiformis]